MTKPQLNIPLNPCPFRQDGETHEVQVLPQGSGYPETWQVVCSCGACGPIDLGESGACDTWNTRPLEDALLEACEATMTHLEDYPPEFYEKGRDDGRDYCIKIARAALALARGEA